MGLDNSLILRSSRLEALESALPRTFGWDAGTIWHSDYFGWRLDILYLRKCWNIRNVVMRECFYDEEQYNNRIICNGEDDSKIIPYMFDREKLETFYRILDEFIADPDGWEDSGSSIWEYGVCKPHLENAHKAVAYMLDHELYEPNEETGIIGLEWIDSY
jgi:hypothetical protein